MLSCHSLLPLKSCIVFVLGDGKLAERMWNAWQDAGTDAYRRPGEPADDPYLTLVNEWGLGHLRSCRLRTGAGNNVITMLSARSLLDLQKAVEPVAAEGAVSIVSTDYLHPTRPEIPFLDFRDSPALLLEKMPARRAKAGPYRRLDVGLERFPDQSNGLPP